MHNKQEKLFYPVIKAYFEKNQSIRKIAKNFNLHYQTVFKWIKHFKKFKNPPLFKPWNRSPEKIETLIIKYKERYPWLTIKQAQKLLLEKNIKISCYGIWNIWKRNGYSGFDKKEFSNDFTDFIILTKEAKIKLMQAEYLFSIGKITEAARILNSITWLPKNDLVLKIPEELLNLRRRIEKLSIDFGKVSLAEYIKKAKIIFQRCIKNQWYYSALRTGAALLYALSWLGDVREQKRLIKKIEKLLPNKKRRPKDLMPIYLTLLLAKIHTFIQMLKITDAMRLARYCYHLLLQHKKPLYDFLYDLAVQFIYLEDYNTAKKLLHKAMVGIDEQKKKKLMVMLAVYVYLLRCDKKNASKILNKAQIHDWATKDVHLPRFQAMLALIEGRVSEAINLSQKALDASKGTGISSDIANAYLVRASIYMALGEREKAELLLNELIKFAKKVSMRRQATIAKVLLKKIPQKEELLKLPTIRLALILKNFGYKAAYRFALKRGIMLYFYRYLLFCPEFVQKRIAKNKPTYLPKAILRLPIFNTKTDVYHINLLGKITTFRNQKYLKFHLSPKDTAILLFIITRINEPEKSLNLNELYKNFWSKSKNPARIFSHSLVRIKKALKIPAHYLEIKRQNGESYLINQNIYFTTDYQEFEQTLAQAKALERVGEWGFARKEYLRAFKLFRGEPFKKNFDNWSVDMRFKILSQFETEAINFAKSCIEHGNKNDARKILQKVLKIIPDSEEAKKLSDSLITL
ncbi:MAG: hypothetical protein ABIL74_05210 [candidate division WOR-3 bacterium]